MEEKIIIVIDIIITVLLIIGFNRYLEIYAKNQEQKEQIKILEQSLQEQIQETEVYRGILEAYQTEGIINE